MRKIFLIIEREYLVRVKKKSFLVLTFLVPLLIAGMYGLIFYLVANQRELSTVKKVLVIDSAKTFSSTIKNSNTLQFTSSPTLDLAKAKKDFKEKTFDFILYVPKIKDTAISEMGGQSLSPAGIQLIGEKQASIQTLADIENEMVRVLKNKAFLAAGIDTAKLNQIRPKINIQNSLITAQGEKNSDSLGSFIIGISSAIIIYMFIFLYGVQVMRGVMEEKTSRVVEVIISSVKPFELMMGKIIGIALVGLTQFLLWVVLSVFISPLLTSGLKPKINSEITAHSPIKKDEVVKKSKTGSLTQDSKALSDSKKENLYQNPKEGVINQLINALSTQNYPFLLACFLFYFIAGYLLYSALFAAIGAAVDSETETQQFMFPISLPLIFSIIISSNYVINNPDSSLSIWLSIIPFFSPVVMMVRLPFHPPIWQLLLSMLFMILGFLGTVFLASKIYKIGILMHGKKVNFAEMAKWLFYKS